MEIKWHKSEDKNQFRARWVWAVTPSLLPSKSLWLRPWLKLLKFIFLSCVHISIAMVDTPSGCSIVGISDNHWAIHQCQHPSETILGCADSNHRLLLRVQMSKEKLVHASGIGNKTLPLPWESRPGGVFPFQVRGHLSPEHRNQFSSALFVTLTQHPD